MDRPWLRGVLQQAADDAAAARAAAEEVTRQQVANVGWVGVEHISNTACVSSRTGNEPPAFITYDIIQEKAGIYSQLSSTGHSTQALQLSASP
jgi:hypothetical protein